uniref:TATA-box binding protein associated factor 7 like n=1 Tax=Sarcophilus harrisii TaxID=9305 RepID=G3WL49_SARHA
MSKNKEDPPHELESQFILRLPPEYASTVRRAVQSGSVNLKDKLSIELHPDGRHGIVRVDRVPLASKLVDLPCVIGSLKTIDKKTFYKTADICQMLVSTVDGDLYPPLEEPVASSDPKVNKKKDKDREKKFIWNHGITLPLKNVRKRRFRKTAKKKRSTEYIESPDVEKEVKRLLSTDAEAVSTRWEVIAEDETKDNDNHGSLASLDISPGMSGHKQGHNSSVQGLQKQIDEMKDKHQETQDRAKRQEDLIFKVENLALKLSSLQEQLDLLLEK